MNTPTTILILLIKIKNVNKKNKKKIFFVSNDTTPSENRPKPKKRAKTGKRKSAERGAPPGSRVEAKNKEGKKTKSVNLYTKKRALSQRNSPQNAPNAQKSVIREKSTRDKMWKNTEYKAKPPKNVENIQKTSVTLGKND